MIEWKYCIERGFRSKNVAFAVYSKGERAPLFHIGSEGFADIDGNVQSCFNKIDLDRHNHLKITGVDVI